MLWGVYYAFQEDYDTALDYFDKAIRIFPYFTEAYFNKGIAYKEKLDIRNMIEALTGNERFDFSKKVS